MNLKNSLTSAAVTVALAMAGTTTAIHPKYIKELQFWN